MLGCKQKGLVRSGTAHRQQADKQELELLETYHV
jgi:hypothetical protein